MSRTAMQRLTLATALALATACGAPTAPTTSGPSGATTAPPASRSIATFTPAPCPTPNVAGIPQLDLGPGFSCGYLTVPENRAQQDGPTIRVVGPRPGHHFGPAHRAGLVLEPVVDPFAWLHARP